MSVMSLRFFLFWFWVLLWLLFGEWFTAGSAGGFRELRRGTLRANFELSEENRFGHLKA